MFVGRAKRFEAYCHYSSSEKEDSKKNKWKISTAEDKKPIIESGMCACLVETPHQQ